MSGFKAKMHQNRFRTPLGELTALPQIPYLDLRDPTSKGGRGRGEGGEGRGTGRRGDDGKGGEGTPVCIFKFSLG